MHLQEKTKIQRGIQQTTPDNVYHLLSCSDSDEEMDSTGSSFILKCTHNLIFSSNPKLTKLNYSFKINYYQVKWTLHLRGASLAKLSSGVVSSGFPSPAPEGRDRIWQIQEVGGQVLTSATIYHTHYSTVLRNRIK